MPPAPILNISQQLKRCPAIGLYNLSKSGKPEELDQYGFRFNLLILRKQFQSSLPLLQLVMGDILEILIELNSRICDLGFLFEIGRERSAMD